MKIRSLLIAVLTVSVFSGNLFAQEKKDSIGISASLETGFGDILTYGEGFEFWVKPNLEWDVFGTGFSLGLGWVVPLYPFGVSPHEIEISENYCFDIGDSGFSAGFGNVNAFTLEDPVAIGGLVYVGVGFKGFSMDIQVHYLAGSVFGFYGLVFVPGYSLELGDFELGAALEIGMWTGETVGWSIEPVIGVSYAF